MLQLRFGDIGAGRSQLQYFIAVGICPGWTNFAGHTFLTSTFNYKFNFSSGGRFSKSQHRQALNVSCHLTVHHNLKMKFEFANTFLDNFNSPPIIISGQDSCNLDRREYLTTVQKDGTKTFYEIRYDLHCSPFKQAIIVDKIFAVGHEEHFYLFSTVTNENMLRLKMGGYFGHLYYDSDLFYVADAGGIYCVDKRGSIKWQNNNLAIDGVVVNEIHPERIFGSGEWDPPGGWRDFILDRQTGITLK